MINSETIDEARRVYESTGNVRKAAMVFTYAGRGVNMAQACRMLRRHEITKPRGDNEG